MVAEKIKSSNSSGYDLCLTDGTKTFSIMFAGNLDVYWYFRDSSTRERSGTFEITKENYKIYELFDKLYNSIKESIVFEVTDLDISHCGSIDDINKLYKDKKQMNDSFRVLSHWNELFHDGVVTWKCDDFPHEQPTNSVNIYKEEDKYVLEFLFKEENYHFTTIRFRNSGSYYNPFNYIFMKMYNSFQEIDFDDKQIHIEEYLYEKKRVLKK